MMILNALNFASAIWVKFCHARFLSASNEMPATANWPSTAIIHHFIKPTVDSVCATRAHLFAQNPLKMLNCHCNKASTSTSGIAKKMKPYLKRSPNKVP